MKTGSPHRRRTSRFFARFSGEPERGKIKKRQTKAREKTDEDLRSPYTHPGTDSGACTAVGEQRAAVLVGAGDDRVFAIKGQGRQPLREAAEVSAAAVGVCLDGILAVNVAGDHGGQLFVSAFGVVLAHQSGAVIQPGLGVLVRQNDRPQLLIAAGQILHQLCGSGLILIGGLRRSGFGDGRNRSASGGRAGSSGRAGGAAAAGQQRNGQGECSHSAQSFLHQTHGKFPPENQKCGG